MTSSEVLNAVNTGQNSGCMGAGPSIKTDLKAPDHFFSFNSSRNLTNGAAGRSRTCDPQIRSLIFYPAELRPH